MLSQNKIMRFLSSFKEMRKKIKKILADLSINSLNYKIDSLIRLLKKMLEKTERKSKVNSTKLKNHFQK